jgi:hypothetical protein
MRKIVSIAAVAALSLALASCGEEKLTQRDIQAKQAEERANSLTFSDNAEIDNIERRIRLTSQPGLIGYIVLLNEAGQPIFYGSVEGKVSSSGKRLNPPDKMRRYEAGAVISTSVGPAPSDEGTWGSSDPYIYFWTSDGQYMQWNGRYLYSNSPIRLSVEPLIVNLGTPTAPEPVAPQATPPPPAPIEG